MSVESVDFRYQATFNIKTNQILDVWTLSIPHELDSAYNLSLAGTTYSVGSGIALQTSPNRILLTVDFRTTPTGKYTGVLISESRISGVYLAIKLVVEVSR